MNNLNKSSEKEKKTKFKHFKQHFSQRPKKTTIKQFSSIFNRRKWTIKIF